MKFCIENGWRNNFNSVNKDGSRNGFDLDICKYLNSIDIYFVIRWLW